MNQLIGRFVQCKQFRSLARIRYFEIIQLIREECDPSTKLRGEGEFEELFEVVGNEGRKKLKEIFCRRPEKLTRSHWKGFFFLKNWVVVNGRTLYDQATKTIPNLKKALSYMEKYTDKESRVVKESRLEVEDVFKQILRDFF